MFALNHTLREVPVQRLTNYQSRFLGWDGTDSGLNDTIDYLRSLDFVGLKEYSTLSRKLLFKRLGWHGTNAADQFWATSIALVPEKRIAESQVIEERIDQIQWADRRLYEEALKIFEQYLALH